MANTNPECLVNPCDNTPFKEPYRRISPGMFQEVRHRIH